MNKKNIYIIAVVFTLVILSAFTIGCSNKDDGVLKTPYGLKIEDEVLSWAAVGGAKSYVVDIDGTEYPADTNSLDLFLLTDEYKSYRIKVIAYGDLKETFDSDWSETLNYNIEAPIGLGYELINDGTEYTVFAEDKEALSGKLIIPSEYEGKPVTTIPLKGFYDCKNLQSVIMADSITEVENSAFRNCSSLYASKLSNELSKIASSTFDGCKNLKKVVMPYGLKSIENYAFFDCTALTEINLPETLEYIGERAFRGCSSLQSLHIPAKVNRMGTKLIAYTDSLTTLTVDSDNAAYKSENNCIIKKEDSSLILGCKTSIIPDYVTKLDEYCFAYCKLLDNITIPKSVTEIQSYAFEKCTSLKNVVFEDGLKVICDNAFKDCTSLQSIRLPASFESATGGAFYGCKNLTELCVDDSNPLYTSIENCIIEKANNTVIIGCAESVIPDGTTAIGEKAFVGVQIKTINIPDTIEKIGKFAFSESTLETVYLHDGLSIDESAFMKCKNLSSVRLPSDLKNISKNMFCECSSLKSIVLPASVEKICVSAFERCQIVVILPKTIQTIEADAFSYGSTVYTDVYSYEQPEGWANYSSQYREIKYAVFSAKVYGCEFGYDDGVPYVISHTHENVSSEVGYDSFYCAEIPVRKGYVFKGWSLTESEKDIVFDVNFFKETEIYSLRSYVFTKTACYVSLNESDSEKLPNGTKLYAIWEKE